MANEGDDRANTTIGRIRRPRVRPLISEQPASTSFSPSSIALALKKRKKMGYTTFDADDVYDSEEDGDLGSDRVHAPPPDVRVSKTAVANVTVGDADALDCGVCFLALRPPIFQCEVGHVVCSACRDKLEATGNGKCHVCRAATRGGYRRCHAMERLVDCIRVPCPHAAHGCDATTPYHGQDSHRQVCPHAPCHCPGGDSCGFVGSTAALLDHFATAHRWPCTTRVRAPEAFSISLHVGFNFVLLTDQDRVDGEQAAATGCRLFLLNVTQERLGRALSVICIHPNTSTTAAATANGARPQLPLTTQCELVFSRHDDRDTYTTSSVFSVVCTDLSNGLPNHEKYFQFFLPYPVLDVWGPQEIQVKARIINLIDRTASCVHVKD